MPQRNSTKKLIFTLPNADTDGRDLIKKITAFTGAHENAHAFTSLGQLRYLSAMAQVDGVVGNSSSGLIETPTFKKGTVNIGDRQRGRLQASSVINCAPTRADILAAIQKLYDADFKSRLKDVVSPYGEGGASERIVALVKTVQLENLLKKRFFDVP